MGLEIIEVDNGFIVLEGSTLASGSHVWGCERKKWIVRKDFDDLGNLIAKIAQEICLTKGNKNENSRAV